MEETFDYVANDQLQGLILPPENMGLNASLWLGLFLLACLFFLLLWRWNKARNSTISIAKRTLKVLTVQYNKKPKAMDDTPLQLVIILCQGLKINRLDQFQATDTKTWASFHKRLNNACYSTNSNSNSDIKTLLLEAKEWLNYEQ